MIDAQGNKTNVTHTPTADNIANSYDVPSPYTLAATNKDAVIFVQDTGELLLGENVYNQVKAML